MWYVVVFRPVLLTCLLSTAGKVTEFGFRTGVQMMDARKQVVKISTGCSAFDELLGEFACSLRIVRFV